ncbi:DJ-1/PfpI family protein [Danxiaibacter flavus]|uniref:DJ-1/PfpI family protein n=1 Tax=Danxiaibacter flavus TaxID=3049108 RepID=A0ABV3ZF98_9BACT|nr:DJ-1/PfpI family protein [Chitinophagaceae bacterium DXS]
MSTLTIGMLLFPELTIQDFVGPYEVFTRVEKFRVLVVSETTGLIKAEGGLSVQADYSFENCPQIDILFVPGGKGITPLLANDTYLGFLNMQGKSASYITAVCTGSVLLGAAGLLNGYKATTHWRSLDLLRMMNIEVIEERVVIDRNRVTGGGITAGIDFGLTLTALLAGEDVAKVIQLMLEYAPEPPFNSGSAKTAEPHILQKARNITQPMFDARVKQLQSRGYPAKP